MRPCIILKIVLITIYIIFIFKQIFSFFVGNIIVVRNIILQLGISVPRRPCGSRVVVMKSPGSIITLQSPLAVYLVLCTITFLFSFSVKINKLIDLSISMYVCMLIFAESPVTYRVSKKKQQHSFCFRKKIKWGVSVQPRPTIVTRALILAPAIASFCSVFFFFHLIRSSSTSDEKKKEKKWCSLQECIAHPLSYRKS